MHILALLLLAGFLHRLRMVIKKQKRAQLRASCLKRVADASPQPNYHASLHA